MTDSTTYKSVTNVPLFLYLQYYETSRNGEVVLKCTSAGVRYSEYLFRSAKSAYEYLKTFPNSWECINIEGNVTGSLRNFQRYVKKRKHISLVMHLSSDKGYRCVITRG
nr:MAG TPA: protein of unknown function (DUF5338) [Caudoviricetes sp.]